MTKEGRLFRITCFCLGLNALGHVASKLLCELHKYAFKGCPVVKESNLVQTHRLNFLSIVGHQCRSAGMEVVGKVISCLGMRVLNPLNIIKHLKRRFQDKL